MKKETDVEIKNIKYGILSFFSLIIIVALVIAALTTKNDKVLLAVSGVMVLLILLNLKYIFINKKKHAAVHLIKREVTSTDIHPLELYIINTIWCHRKKRINREQIYASLLYELLQKHIIVDEKGVKIPNDVNLDNVSIYTLMTYEMALLDKIDCRKIRRLKIAKLKSLQSEEVAITLEDLNNNIVENCSDTHLFYERMTEMNEQYFESIESFSTVYLTLISWFMVIISTLFLFTFFENATIINFFLPLSLTVILVATLTSKNRERVTIKTEQLYFISNALNYINYLENSEKSRVNDIYAYCLGKTNDNKYIKIFKN